MGRIKKAMMMIIIIMKERIDESGGDGEKMWGGRDGRWEREREGSVSEEERTE